MVETEDFVNLEIKTERYTKGNTMELVKGICVDLTQKYELKLKIKSTKG